MILLVNASQIFEKGDPSRAERDRLPKAARRVNAGAFINNFIPEAGIQRIADTLIGWKEEEKLSRIIDLAELRKNDYNISPSRYIHTGDADLSAVALAKEETYRPIGEIVAELVAIEAEAKETDKALRKILEQIGI